VGGDETATSTWALPCLSQFPRPISRLPCCFRQASAGFLLSTSDYYFFFFAAFLAFLFFAITSLHLGLRKQNKKTAQTATAYSIAGKNSDGSNPFASRHA
jgi:hypothetical protein